MLTHRTKHSARKSKPSSDSAPPLGDPFFLSVSPTQWRGRGTGGSTPSHPRAVASRW
jgi:hypothetical protein